MKTQISSKVVATAAIVMGWSWLTAIQCGDVIVDPKVQDCPVPTYDSGFPSSGYLYLNKPAHCPLRIPGFTEVAYAASADLPAGSVSYDFYQSQHIDMNGSIWAVIFEDVWGQGNGRYLVNISGNYNAGIGGFGTGNRGHDDLKNGFWSSTLSRWVYATTRITYELGFPSNSIDAPEVVYPGIRYPVTATTSDPLLTDPVTWSWYVDGSLAGTTTSPSFKVLSGAESTEQLVEVVATDGNGRSVSGQTTVWVSSEW